MKSYNEMRAKGNHPLMALFKIFRRKLTGAPLLLNKGWDFSWKADRARNIKAMKANKIKDAVIRQLRRNGYDGKWKIKVENGRWSVEYGDVSGLLK